VRPVYAAAGVDASKETIVHSGWAKHDRFVLLEMLDQPNIQNFDGSWSGYGPLLRMAIEKGHVAAHDGARLRRAARR
jgi:thiosulfate/3-mercaptopyruvate sulfurtransferase